MIAAKALAAFCILWATRPVAERLYTLAIGELPDWTDIEACAILFSLGCPDGDDATLARADTLSRTLFHYCMRDMGLHDFDAIVRETCQDRQCARWTTRHRSLYCPRSVAYVEYLRRNWEYEACTDGLAYTETQPQSTR